MAFHLGCLRALHELGILEQVKVLSTVSGGSAIGALYTAHEGSFEDLEARVRAVLRQGLARPTVLAAITTTEGVKAVVCWALLGSANLAFVALKWAVWLGTRTLGRSTWPARRAIDQGTDQGARPRTDGLSCCIKDDE